MKIVQILSHDGYLWALSAGGSIFMLASDTDGMEYWFRVSGPFDDVADGDVNPPTYRDDAPIEVRAVSLDHLPEGST